MKKVAIVFFTLSLIAFFSSSAFADPILFSGSTIGNWENVNSKCKDDEYTINNQTKNNPLKSVFKWGVPFGNSTPSKLAFIGKSFTDIEADQAFLIGNFNFKNGINTQSVGIKGVDLVVSLNLVDPFDQCSNYDFSFHIKNTYNKTGNNTLDGDFVSMANVVSSSTFAYKGVAYTLALEGFSNDGGKSFFNCLKNPEDNFLASKLYGKIKTASVPEPSTVPLLFMSVVTLFGFIRRKK